MQRAHDGRAGLALLMFIALVQAVYAHPTPPVWPEAFEVQYTLSLPYVASVQSSPLKYPVHIWFNQSATLMRTSFYDGLDDIFVTPTATYFVYPRITSRSCMVIGAPVGPSLERDPSLSEPAIANPLPDISTWQYGGPSVLVGRGVTDTWIFTWRAFEKVATYTFHVSQRDKSPMRLDMMGVNLFTGSHFDQYVVDFHLYVPSLASSNTPFTPPYALCDKSPSLLSPLLSRQQTLVAAQARGVLPSHLVPSAAAGVVKSDSVSAQGEISSWWQRLSHTLDVVRNSVVVRRLPTPAPATLKDLSSNNAPDSDVSGANDIMTRNVRLIHEWNEARRRAVHSARSADAKRMETSKLGIEFETEQRPQVPVAVEDLYTLDVNRFVTWDDATWRASRTGHLPSKQRASKAYLGVYKRRLSDDQLPRSVDWRGTGADGPVKDQASCGSCWAFATTGAMTAAWYLATNQSLSFSEQQLVDCSWDYVCPDGGCGGCWGGNSEPALQYLADSGGAVLEANYPYKGQNSVCRDKLTNKAAQFKGYVNVPPKDEKALMEAVAVHGPLSISFDAGHPTFKFYSEGVYYREDCFNDSDHLDHAVVLVGYGTTPAGTDYWLLRNSWSQYWGDGGYFKMARKGNDCGVTVDGVLAVVDDDAAARARDDEMIPSSKRAAAAAESKQNAQSRAKEETHAGGLNMAQPFL